MEVLGEANATAGDWQLNKSVLQCNEFMFTHQVACDVVFNVRSGSDASVEEIGAHKYVLLSRSPVFYAMFRGEMNTDVVEIVDSEPEAFKLMLRYIYTDTVKLNAECVMAVMYISKKYMILPLVAQCKNYLETSITTDNVCLIYQQSALFAEEDLTKTCLDFIKENTDDVIQTSSFRNLSADCLKGIVRSDALEVSELSLFLACVTWAKDECERRDVDTTAENRRTALGDILYQIRFPLLSSEELADAVHVSGILEKEELADIFLYQYSSVKPELVFPVEDRQTWKPICLHLCQGTQAVAQCLTGQNYKMAITTSKDVNVIGMQLFNSQAPDSIKQVVIGMSQNCAQLYNSTVSSTDKGWATCEEGDIDVTLSMPVMVMRGKFTISIAYKSNTFYGQGIPVSTLTNLKGSVTSFGVTLSDIIGSRVVKAIVFRRA